MRNSVHATGRCARTGCLDPRSLTATGRSLGRGAIVYAPTGGGGRGRRPANREQVGECLSLKWPLRAPSPQAWVRPCVSESVDE